MYPGVPNHKFLQDGSFKNVVHRPLGAGGGGPKDPLRESVRSKLSSQEPLRHNLSFLCVDACTDGAKAMVGKLSSA